MKTTIKSWKGLFILSLLLPVTFFVGMKATGVITGPVKVANITQLQTAVWTRAEPYYANIIPGDPYFNTSYVGNDIALSVSDYCEEGSFAPQNNGPYGGDTLAGFGLQAINASVPYGFIVSVEVAYQEAYSQSSADFFEPETIASSFANLTISQAADSYLGGLPVGDKLYLKASALDRPQEVSMGGLSIEYHLGSPYNYTHQIMTYVTVTYFNGTFYEQIVQPLELVFGPDHNNSFEEATPIGLGQLQQGYVDFDVNGDSVDYFKINLTQGENVRISVQSQYNPSTYNPPQVIPDVFVYDPNLNVKDCLLYAQNSTASINLGVNETGWWYIMVTGFNTTMYFSYDFTVSLI